MIIIIRPGSTYTALHREQTFLAAELIITQTAQACKFAQL